MDHARQQDHRPIIRLSLALQPSQLLNQSYECDVTRLYTAGELKPYSRPFLYTLYLPRQSPRQRPSVCLRPHQLQASSTSGSSTVRQRPPTSSLLSRRQVLPRGSHLEMHAQLHPLYRRVRLDQLNTLRSMQELEQNASARSTSISRSLSFHRAPLCLCIRLATGDYTFLFAAARRFTEIDHGF